MSNELILTPLEKALSQLQLCSTLASEALKTGDMLRYPVYRTAVIQAFEFCYELCMRMMKRYFQLYAPLNENLDAIKFKDFMRLAAEAELIDNPAVWTEFRQYRNTTSHTYDEKRAEELMQIIPFFAEKAEAVFKALTHLAQDKS